MLEVLCPRSEQPLAAEVKVASIVAQYASMLSFPSTGTAVGRLLATRSLVMCNSDASASVVGLLPLTVQVCDDEGASSDARGAVLGNLLIWGVASIASLQRLEHLDLRCCRAITDAGLVSIARLKQLRHLVIRYFEEITDAGLVSIASLPHLQYLDIHGCKKTTSKGRALVASALTWGWTP